MIAFHYPPVVGSSGIQRTLKFSQYLPEYGWEPLVLSAHPRAYASTGEGQLREIPADRVVKRAFALDTARHLALRGRYPSLLALPDRWVGWWLGAVPAGLALIRRYRPAALWSTYPIATAHLIGLTLQRLTGLPWIADFRDSMTEDGYPASPRLRRVYQWLERATVTRCRHAVFTTPGALRMYAARYPQIDNSRWALIENGYDEENFCDAEGAVRAARAADAPLVLLHSGILYPSERDPSAFFQALAGLKRAGQLSCARLKVVLRASGHDDHLRRLIDGHGVSDLVALAPPLPYREALAEMLAADGLLIFQAANCNHQIPAKLYEYLRAKRPLLALTDPGGDTAAALRATGIDTIARLDAEDEIRQALVGFLAGLQAGTAPVASATAIASHSRRARTGQLARLLQGLATGG